MHSHQPFLSLSPGPPPCPPQPPYWEHWFPAAPLPITSNRKPPVWAISIPNPKRKHLDLEPQSLPITLPERRQVTRLEKKKIIKKKYIYKKIPLSHTIIIIILFIFFAPPLSVSHTKLLSPAPRCNHPPPPHGSRNAHGAAPPAPPLPTHTREPGAVGVGEG